MIDSVFEAIVYTSSTSPIHRFFAPWARQCRLNIRTSSKMVLKRLDRALLSSALKSFGINSIREPVYKQERSHSPILVENLSTDQNIYSESGIMKSASFPLPQPKISFLDRQHVDRISAQ